MIRRDDILALQRAVEALPERPTRAQVAQSIADVIAAGNPKFKRASFVKLPEPKSVPAIPSPFDAALEERLNRIMEED